MASYEELTELNEKADEQASQLAQEVTVKDILEYWKDPYDYSASEQLVFDSASLLVSKAMNDWEKHGFPELMQDISTRIKDISMTFPKHDSGKDHEE